MSWNSKMAKARRPWSLPISPRSDSSCRPTAVDDNASAMPITSAAFKPEPRNQQIAPSARPVNATCSAPTPNTAPRITFNRGSDSSRPITNSIITTPISLAVSTRSGSDTTFNACGPSNTPAAR